MPVEAIEQRLQLVERPADRAAGAGRVLDQKPRVAVAALEDLRERAAGAGERGPEPCAQVGADVEDDAVGADRVPGRNGGLECSDRLLADPPAGGRGVAEVDARAHPLA